MKSGFKDLKIRFISVHCVCSMVDFKFNHKTPKRFKPSYVRARASSSTDHLAKGQKKALTREHKLIGMAWGILDQ